MTDLLVTQLTVGLCSLSCRDVIDMGATGISKAVMLNAFLCGNVRNRNSFVESEQLDGTKIFHSLYK